jgi:hypothetical protein
MIFKGGRWREQCVGGGGSGLGRTTRREERGSGPGDKGSAQSA